MRLCPEGHAGRPYSVPPPPKSGQRNSADGGTPAPHSGVWSGEKSRARSRADPRAWDVTAARSSSRSSVESSASSSVRSGDGPSGTSVGADVTVGGAASPEQPLCPRIHNSFMDSSTVLPQPNRLPKLMHHPIYRATAHMSAAPMTFSPMNRSQSRVGRLGVNACPMNRRVGREEATDGPWVGCPGPTCGPCR
jgi:hypothetical protein